MIAQSSRIILEERNRNIYRMGEGVIVLVGLEVFYGCFKEEISLSTLRPNSVLENFEEDFLRLFPAISSAPILVEKRMSGMVYQPMRYA